MATTRQMGMNNDGFHVLIYMAPTIRTVQHCLSQVRS